MSVPGSDVSAPVRLAGFTHWGVFWLLAAVLAAGVFFANGIDALLTAWQLPEYSHGPLIPILSGLLFLRQLKELVPCRIQGPLHSRSYCAASDFCCSRYK